MERLGLSAAVAATAAGERTSQGLRDVLGGRKRLSADLLAALATTGIDPLYILTGQRSQPVPEGAALPKEERALLNSYRLCGAAARKNLLQTAALLAAGLEAERMPKQRIKISAGGHAAGRDMTIKKGGG